MKQHTLDQDQAGGDGSSYVTRMVDEEAYDKSMMDDCVQTFYDYFKKGVQQPPAVIVARGSGPTNPDSAPVVPVKGGYAPRRARITKDELQRCGSIAGCLGCLSAKLGDGL